MRAARRPCYASGDRTLPAQLRAQGSRAQQVSAALRVLRGFLHCQLDRGDSVEWEARRHELAACGVGRGPAAAGGALGPGGVHIQENTWALGGSGPGAEGQVDAIARSPFLHVRASPVHARCCRRSDHGPAQGMDGLRAA
jgi:hypothetical protein